MPKTTIDISLSSIFRVVGVGLLLLFLFAVKDLLILLLFALVLASAITPLVNWFEDHGVPRVISLLAVVALLIALIALIGITIVPHLIREFAGLARDFPTYWDVITTEFGKLGLLENEIVSEGVQGVLDGITVFFGRGLSSFSAILFGVLTGTELRSFYGCLRPMGKKRTSWISGSGRRRRSASGPGGSLS